jgi:hypothetical protein
LEADKWAYYKEGCNALWKWRISLFLWKNWF